MSESKSGALGRHGNRGRLTLDISGVKVNLNDIITGLAKNMYGCNNNRKRTINQSKNEQRVPLSIVNEFAFFKGQRHV